MPTARRALAKSALTRDVVSIPEVPQGKLLGNGHVHGHEGLDEVELTHPTHQGLLRDELSAEEDARGLTRFYRWHIDAAQCAYPPPELTAGSRCRCPRAGHRAP